MSSTKRKCGYRSPKNETYARIQNRYENNLFLSKDRRSHRSHMCDFVGFLHEVPPEDLSVHVAVLIQEKDRAEGEVNKN